MFFEHLSFTRGVFVSWRTSYDFVVQKNARDLIGAQEVQRQQSGEVGALVLGR